MIAALIALVLLAAVYGVGRLWISWLEFVYDKKYPVPCACQDPHEVTVRHGDNCCFYVG